MEGDGAVALRRLQTAKNEEIEASVTFWCQVGNELLKEDHKQAISVFTATIESAPNRQFLRKRVSEIYLTNQRYLEVIRECEFALQEEPRNIWLWKNL